MTGRFFSLLLLASLAPVAHAVQHPAEVVEFFDFNCIDCHDSKSKKGGLDLTALSTDWHDPAVMAKWVRIHDRVERGEMPPPDKFVLEAEDKKPLLQYLDRNLTEAHAAKKGTVIRRLNRVEYENTLNDLLGIRVEVAGLLPEDGQYHGFDNVGEALDLSAVQLARYLEAAGIALDAATRKVAQPEKVETEIQLDTGKNDSRIGQHWLQLPNGNIVVFGSGFPPKSMQFRAPAEGRYRLRADVAAYQSEEPIPFKLSVGSSRDDSHVLPDTFLAEKDASTPVEIDLYLRENDRLQILPDLPGRKGADRKKPVEEYPGPGMIIGDFVIEGPFFEEWPGRGHELLFGELRPTLPKADEKKRQRGPNEGPIESAQPEADIDRLLPGFITAAFRRPVTPEETAPYRELAKAELAAGANFEEAMRTAHLAVLTSPQFLYLIEPAGALDDFALASRLSYFLWSSLPDAELLELASRGQLRDPKVLRAQTERLLQDPRGDRFTRNFVGQWLALRQINDTTPDKRLYPEFTPELQEAMVAETELFFDEILGQNLSTLDFIDSDWTYANDVLAKHYGLPEVEGHEMRRVKLRPEDKRGGVMTHGSVLKVSANGANTSPVLRGVWVLERILGVEPPPPPPGVPGLEPDIRGATTIREQLAQHRDNPSCRGCHLIIDPPGFALENYDVIGGWRENYRSLGEDFPSPDPKLTGGQRVRWRVGPDVDASGQTINGQAFTDLDTYKAILLANPDKLAHAMADKLALYATGRPMGFSDRYPLHQIVEQVAPDGYRFRDLLHAVVQSEIFRTK